MNSYVFAGMGGQIISKLSNFLFKFLDSLIKDSNYQVDQIKEEKTDDGKKYITYRITDGAVNTLLNETETILDTVAEITSYSLNRQVS